MILQILEITGPVFALAAIGFVWVKLGADYDIAFVTRLAMQVSIPCLIVSVMSTIEIDPEAFTRVALASLAAYGAVAVLSVAALRWLGVSFKAYLAPFIFGNTGNMGLPIAYFAYGEQGLVFAMVVFAVMATLSFTLGIWVTAGLKSPMEPLKQPVFYSAVLGSVIALEGWTPPNVVLNTLELVGQIAIPAMLITLGVAMARLNVRSAGAAFGLSLAKAAICAAAGVGAAWGFGLEDAAAGALILQVLMPVAVTNYMLAAKYGTEPEGVAGLVVISTVVSVFALPAALALLLG